MASKAQLRTVLKKTKNKPTNRNNRASWLQKAVKYLKSDSYLFGPLLDPSPSTTNNGCSSVHTPRFLWFRRKSTKGLIGDNVMEYLKSDSYLYGPFLLNQRPNDCNLKKVMSKDKNKYSSVFEPSNVTVENKLLHEEEDDDGGDVVLPLTPERNHINGGHQRQKKSVRRKEMVTVTHMVRRSSRSSPSSAVSGMTGKKSIPDPPSRSRMLAVER